MEALEHGYREFTDLLQEEELHELVLKYGAADSVSASFPFASFAG